MLKQQQNNNTALYLRLSRDEAVMSKATALEINAQSCKDTQTSRDLVLSGNMWTMEFPGQLSNGLRSSG